MISSQSVASVYDKVRNTMAPSGSGRAEGVAGQFGSAAAEFERVLDRADSASTGAMMGKVDTHDLVQSLAEAQLALDAAVAIRDKVVEAYQEILRMPV